MSVSFFFGVVIKSISSTSFSKFTRVLISKLVIVSNRQRNFFWAMSCISFKIHQIHPKFDGDHESVSYFDHSLIVEELLV